VEQHGQRSSCSPTSGSDRGFLIRYGAALVGLGAAYVFREDVTRIAAHPQAAHREVEALVAWITEFGGALTPIVGLLLLAVVATGLLICRLRSRPLTVPRLRPGDRRIRMGRILGSRRTYDVPTEGLFDHWLILGRSRFGKSHHASGLARQYFDSHLTGLVLIDPHDELCRSFIASSYRSFGNRPVTWASFGRGDLCPGLNLLERLPGESPAQVAERFVSLIDWLYFAGESVDHQKCTNNLRLAAWAVSSAGGFLPDLRVFLTNYRYRGWLAANTRDRFLLQAISEYNGNVSHDPGWPQSALNRLADLIDNEPLRRIVCQETTVDLRPALDRNGVLLVSLDESVLGTKGVFILAGLLLHQIAAHLKRRPKDDDFHQNPRVRLILDEAQRGLVERGLVVVDHRQRHSGEPGVRMPLAHRLEHPHDALSLALALGIDVEHVPIGHGGERRERDVSFDAQSPSHFAGIRISYNSLTLHGQTAVQRIRCQSGARTCQPYR
jgi:hypothetical protein